MSKQHQIVVVPVEYPVPSPSSISIGEALDRVKATVSPAAPLTTSVVALVVYDPSIEAAPRAAPRANTREAGPGPDSQQAQAKPESYYTTKASKARHLTIISQAVQVIQASQARKLSHLRP